MNERWRLTVEMGKNISEKKFGNGQKFRMHRDFPKLIHFKNSAELAFILLFLFSFFFCSTDSLFSFIHCVIVCICTWSPFTAYIADRWWEMWNESACRFPFLQQLNIWKIIDYADEEPERKLKIKPTRNRAKAGFRFHSFAACPYAVPNTYSQSTFSHFGLICFNFSLILSIFQYLTIALNVWVAVDVCVLVSITTYHRFMSAQAKTWKCGFIISS